MNRIISCRQAIGKLPAVALAASRRGFGGDQSSFEAAAAQVSEACKGTESLISGVHCFVGTAQYYSSAASDAAGAASGEPHERFVVMTLGDSFMEPYAPIEICDVVLPSTVGVDAVEHTLLVSGALSVVQGETDAISDSAWNFGLFKETMVGIFSAEGSLLRVVFNVDQPAFELDINHGAQNLVTVPFATVESVAVQLSEDHAVRQLVLNTSDKGRVVLVEDNIPEMATEEGVLVSAGPEALLMATTEWLVKTAGHVTLQLRQFGYQAPLNLPKALTAEGNSFVRQRNAAWKKDA